MWAVRTASACLLTLALCRGQDNTRWSRPVDDRAAGDWIPLNNDQLSQASARALAQPLPQQNHLFGQQGSFGQQQTSSDTGKYIGNGGGFNAQDFLQPRFPQSILPQQLPPQFLNQQFGSPFSNAFSLGQPLIREPFIGQQENFIPPPLPPPPPPPPPQSLPPPPVDQPLSSNLKPNENYYNQDSGRPFDQGENLPPTKSLPKRPTQTQPSIQGGVGSYKGKDGGRENEEVQILYVPVETLKNQRGRGNKGTAQQEPKQTPLSGIDLQQGQKDSSNYRIGQNPPKFAIDQKFPPHFEIEHKIPPNFGFDQKSPSNFGFEQKNPNFGFEQNTPHFGIEQNAPHFGFEQSSPPNFGIDQRFPSNFGPDPQAPLTPTNYELGDQSIPLDNFGVDQKRPSDVRGNSSPSLPPPTSPPKPTQERQKESKKFRHPIQPLASQKPAPHINNFSEIKHNTGLPKSKEAQDSQKDYDNQRDNTQQIVSSPTQSSAPGTTVSPRIRETQPYTVQNARQSTAKAQEKEPDEFYNPHFSQYLTESKQTQTAKRIPLIQKQVNSNYEDVAARTLPPPNQPPLSVYMETTANSKIGDVLSLLKNAKTIPVLDTIGPDSPQVFVGPSNLKPPHGYVKFELPYLSSLDGNRVEHKVLQLPFFVAPLNFQPPAGYSKIPFPPPHIGSVVLSNNSPNPLENRENVTPLAAIPQTTPSHSAYTIPADISSISPQLPSLINNLQVDGKYNGLSTTQDIIQETTIAPVTQERTVHHSRRPHHRGSQRQSYTTTEAEELSTTRRPVRQRRPFTSRNSARHTTTPLQPITTTTEAYYSPAENDNSEKHQVREEQEDYQTRLKNNDGSQSHIPNYSYTPASIQNNYNQPDTKHLVEDKPNRSHYREEERQDVGKQQFSENNYRPSYSQDKLNEPSDIQNQGNLYRPEHNFVPNDEKHIRPQYNQEGISDSAVTSTESVLTDNINSPKFRNTVRNNPNENIKSSKHRPTDFADGIEVDPQSKFYSPGQFTPTIPDEYVERRPIIPLRGTEQDSQYNNPIPSDYHSNLRFTNPPEVHDDQQEKQRPLPTKDLPTSNLRIPSEERPENVQFENDFPSEINENYSPQYHQGNIQLKSNTNKPSKPSFLDSSYYDQPTESHFEEYITTENHLKSLSKTTSNDGDLSTYQANNKDASTNQEEEHPQYEQPRFRTRLQNAGTKSNVETQKDSYVPPPTTPIYSTAETTTIRNTERGNSRLRGRVRGRGSYTARVKPTTERPNYPSIPTDNEQKEVTQGYHAVKTEASTHSFESSDSEYNTLPTTESTRSITNKYSHSRTASRRPLRPIHRLSTSPTTTISVTSPSPPGVKYLIKTKRPQAVQVQTKLSTGRSRIRRPTAPTTTTTESPTEAPKLYNTQFPSQIDDEEENKFKYFTKPIGRLPQISSHTESKVESPSESYSLDYKPVTSSFDPNGNIKFVHNIRSSTSTYLQDEASTDNYDPYIPQKDSHKEIQPTYSKSRPYASSKKLQHSSQNQDNTDDVRINFKSYDTPEISTRPFYEELRETTRKSIDTSTPVYSGQEKGNNYDTRKNVPSTTHQYDEEEEPVTVQHHSPRRGQSHRFHETDSSRSERLSNHRQTDYQPRELTKSEKQKQAEDFWNQAVTIQQSKSYEYEPESPIFSTPGPVSKTSKSSKNEYDYDDYFNVPEQGKYDKAVTDQSPFPSNDQQFTYTGLKPQGEVGKENQYPDKLTTSSYKSTSDEYTESAEKEESEKAVDLEQPKMSSRSDIEVGAAPVTQEIDYSSTSKKPSRRKGTWVRVKVKKLRDVFETAESQSFGSLSSNAIHTIDKAKASTLNKTKGETAKEENTTDKVHVSSVATEEGNVFTTPKAELIQTQATTDYFNVEEQTDVPSFTTTVTEAIITDDAPTTPLMESSTHDVPSIPPWESKVLGTSTTTEISLETEICYRGRCVKTRRAPQITKDTSDLITTD